MRETRELDRRRAALSGAQRELLERRLRGEPLERAVPTGIPRRVDAANAPLSFPQQRLWFLDRLMPGNAFYNEQVVLPIRFALNVEALERALNEIVRRHEVLRTRFALDAGQPVQIVEPQLDLPLAVVDLERLPVEDRGAEAQRLAIQEARKPFDLSTGPLLRTTLLRLDQSDAILVLTLHHIVCDGWSMQILGRELTALYGAFASGQPSPLTPLPIQYADFAVWQRQSLQGPTFDRLLTYWRERLDDLPALQLPADYPRPRLPTFQGDQHVFELSGAVTQALKELSQRRRVTLYMTLLAAFSVLLHRYSGQDDIVIGAPIANRNRARELESLIGFFVNTLILRIDLSGDPTFTELLERVRDVTLGAQEHQDLPFEKLVEELQPERDLSRNPLCQVAFQLFNIPGSASSTADPATLPWQPASGSAKFDLRVDLGETPSGLRGYFEYSTDLFSGTTIAAMAAHFQTLLEAAVSTPERRLSALPMLTTDEQRRLLVDWNATDAPFPRDICIHQDVESHARQRPDAIACVFGGEQLTYAQLNRRANQLAQFLRSRGVGRETPVGLCMERSLDMLVGLLGILKAGGAYVPLDPSYPAERLRFMLEDARLMLLLTQQHLSARLPEGSTEHICVDRSWEQIERFGDDNPADGATPSDLAYIIYTSGSTGRPKGVLIEHGGLINVAQAQIAEFGVDASSQVLQFSSLSFDASIFEIVMAWHSGATLCVGSREELMPGAPLLQYLRDHAITIVTLPPSALAALPVEPLPALTTITVAGEACPQDLVDTWAPGRRFFNLYGPTEATIWATSARCHPGEPRPSIGRPIANTQVYVLDRFLNPTPVGVHGELWIGGVGLARGYLNRPELTDEMFVPNPFSSTPVRLYRTGDLARFLPDGTLDFLGRVDHQVKIRGYRIEPGEIEAVLERHPAVHEAVVVDRDDGGRDRYLAAFVVANEGTDLSGESLRGYLREQLPEFMTPSRIALLGSLPRLPGGKLDRQALPSIEMHGRAGGIAYAPPRTALEQEIATIWQEELSLEQVGMNDNFFDLGGHSLLLARVHSRLNDLVASDLSMVDLFRFPTIALLAQRLSTEIEPEPSAAEDDVMGRAGKQREAMRRRRQRVADVGRRSAD